MSILLNNTTRVIVQGITGREGQFHTKHMQAAGTHIVGDVTPGKGGQTVAGVPVFDTISQAVADLLEAPNCVPVHESQGSGS